MYRAICKDDQALIVDGHKRVSRPTLTDSRPQCAKSSLSSGGLDDLVHVSRTGYAEQAGPPKSSWPAKPIRPNDPEDQNFHFRNTAIEIERDVGWVAPKPKHPLCPATMVS